jgi:hypothetical protein
VNEPQSAGSSARREYDRRRQHDDAKLRARFGRLAPLVRFLGGEKPSTKAWKTGAEGESITARSLEMRAGRDVLFLHDRWIPGARANIDHFAVTRAAVWVVDSKKWAGRIEKRLAGPPFAQKPHLYIRGRDRSDALMLLSWQVEVVMDALAGPGELVPIRSALCLVSEDWGFLQKPLRFGDALVTWPRELGRTLRAEVSGIEDHQHEIWSKLASKFPPKR